MKRVIAVVLTGMLLGVGASVAAPAVAGAGSAQSAKGCAPGTFDDTDGVVSLIDKTINKEMGRVETAFKHAKLAPGDAKTVQVTLSTGVIVKTTLSRSSDGNTLSFELDMAQPSPSPSFVVITTGSRTDAGTVDGVHTINQQVSVDYDALRTFVPTKPTGSFDATIVDVKDSSKPAPSTQHTLSVSFSGITVSPKDKHGARTGSYTHIGEPNIGGSLDFQASIPVPCPGDPSIPSVEIAVQRRHVDVGTTEHFFRRDAKVTGGNLAGGAAIGFTCGTNPVKGSTTQPSSYELHKVEDASGATLKFTTKLHNETAPNCDPDFGPLPSPTDNSTDSPFSHPVTFPGEW